MKDETEFNPVDEHGNDINWIKCNFDKQGSCQIQINNRQDVYYDHDWETVNSFSPKVLFHKGDKKSDVNTRLVDSLQEAVIELTDKIEQIIKGINTKLKKLKADLETPFVADKTRDIALESINTQLQDMKLRQKDCERLMNMIE